MTSSDLPDEDEYGGTYGDAYAIGASTPYNYYIWTRPNDDTDYPHWFLLGEFPLEGPQGEKGDTGAQGPQGASTQWYTASTDPYSVGPGMNIGDFWLNTVTFQVFKLTEVATIPTWVPVGTIKGTKGEQGIQGPQGPQGPAGQNGTNGRDGTSFTIKGHLNSPSALPTPTSVSDAYLVDDTDGTHLYVCIESETPGVYVWDDTGLLNGGSTVTVGGVYQNTYEMNNKVNASLLSTDATANTVPQRDMAGRVKTADPATGNDALNYQYMQAHIPNKASWSQNDIPIYDNGAWSKLPGTTSPDGYAIVQRDSSGQILVKVTPTAPDHAASKAYVDTVIPDIEVV